MAERAVPPTNSSYGQAVVIPGLGMLVLLALLAWWGTGLSALTFVASWLVVVAVARLLLWHGRRRALAASLAGLAVGALVLFFLIPFACYWPGALEIPSLTDLLLEKPEAIAWFVAMLGPLLLLGVLSYLVHLFLCAWESTWELAKAAHSAWRARQPLSSALKRRLLLQAGGVAFFISVATVSYSIVEVKTCSLITRFAIVEATNPPRRFRLPVLDGFVLLKFGSDYYAYPERYYELYLSCRDRLVAAGVLVHRRFVFKHLKDGTAEAAAVLEAAVAAFPENVHIGAPYNPDGALALEVYATEAELWEWERFVREHDRPPRGKEG